MTNRVLLIIAIVVAVLFVNGRWISPDRGRFDVLLRNLGGDPSCAFLQDGCPPPGTDRVPAK